MTMLRGTLISMLFSWTLTTKADQVETTAATSLMGTDVERIVQSLMVVHELWANIIELGIAIWLLERQLGIGSIMPLVIAAACMLGTTFISSRIGAGQKAWLSAVQKRLTVTVEALRSTRAIKLLGITDHVSNTIQGLRADEIRISLPFRRLLVWTVTLSESSNALAPGLTFLVYILAQNSNNNTLVTNRAFVSLSILSLLGSPLASLIQSIPTVMSAVACFQRVQNYIDLPRTSDPRIVMSMKPGAEKDTSVSQKKESDAKKEVSGLADFAILVRDATIAWPKMESLLLADLNFTIPVTGLTVVVGEIGVGKTSLLQALLGGIQPNKGTITIRKGQVAYCGQASWFMNNTIRKNIIGPLPFEQLWYDEVIHACGLVHDFSQLPDKDFTLVGNEGSVLSGGQKQRVTMARAVYSRAPVVMLDNSLSGLDKRTERWVFDNLMGQRGLLKKHGRSVILVTHNILWLKWWSSANVEKPNQDLGQYLGVYVALGFLAVLCIAIACWVALTHMVPMSGRRVHQRLLDATMQAPLWFLTSTGIGSITNRFSQDIQLVDMQLPLAGINLMEYLTTSVMRLILICVSAHYVSVTAPLVILAIYFLQKFYLRTSRQIRLLDLEAKAPLYSHFLETVSGLIEIRALGWESEAESENLRLLDASQRPSYILLCIQRWLTFVLDCIVAGIGTLTVGLSVARVGGTSGGDIGVALINLINFSQSLAYTVTYWASIETSIGAISRIREFETQTPSENLPQKPSSLPVSSWPSEGKVEYRNVVAAYSPAQKPVLKGVSLVLESGQKVGICGRTGSGKTSLLLALCQMVHVQNGEILVDSVDLNLVVPEQVRKRLTVIPQDAFLLEGSSCRENVDPYHESSDAAIQAAFATVHLGDKILQLGGLNAKLENTSLSQGQKQLFCMARAILRKSKLVLLDEACSNVDDDTAAIMQQCIRHNFQQATVVAVDHNVHNFVGFDQVIVMDGGRIAESGTPEELLSQSGSKLKQLWMVGHS
ncbi:ABC multidrug transporter [Phlyctema vagabunda]|uniref:ABC multidrug transporter n=1 Tax=Phlyctema vagabunda TaxID=108571 RepID=A0ABR4P705_9HELO